MTDDNKNTEPVFENIEQEQIDNSVSLMDTPFDPTKINIETKTPSLLTLINRIGCKKIQLNTESYFQRNPNLWDDTKQSRLIESILIKFPLPAFYFDATDENNWLVVDGLQRLSSINNFVFGKLKLVNLEFLTQFNGKMWNELPTNLQTAIEETQIVIYKILQGTPTDVKFNIFKRINTGGLVLEPQEIRHALFQGKPAKFIAKLATSKAFLDVTERKISPIRMLDRDFVNRFLCFYLLGTEKFGTKEYGQDLDTFMSKAMASIYTKSDFELEKIKSDFEKSMVLSKSIFGKEAFRKVYISYNRLPPINKALFDAISVQLALLTDEERTLLLEYKKDFKKDVFNELNKQKEFFIAVTSSTGDKNRTIFRHNKIKELINNRIK
ncbi:MAG: DUF262 domain-containing protein [Prevotellaceae bacterium]|jgi:hypothetical protein|nr:DUF262 domain-containing protein [Prevotellaceae bacterium]